MELIQLGKRNGSGKLLLTLKQYPNRKFTINELAKTAVVPFATAYRAILEWEKAGIIGLERVGRAGIVTLNATNQANALLKMFEMPSPYGSTIITLKELLKKENKIMGAELFGSAAEGKENYDSDIDLAIQCMDESTGNHLAEELYSKTRLKLIPLAFRKRKSMDEFLKGKKTVKLK
jgi:predicted nucleotidyltransferase